MVLQQPTAVVPCPVGLGVDAQTRLGEVQVTVEHVLQISVSGGVQSSHKTLLPDVPESVKVGILTENGASEDDQIAVQLIGFSFGEDLLQARQVLLQFGLLLQFLLLLLLFSRSDFESAVLEVDF